MMLALTGLVFAATVVPGYACSARKNYEKSLLGVVPVSAIGGNGGMNGGEIGGSEVLDSPANGIDGDTNELMPGENGTIGGGIDGNGTAGNGMNGNGVTENGDAVTEEDKLNSDPDNAGGADDQTDMVTDSANGTDDTNNNGDNSDSMTNGTNWAAIIIAIVIAVALVAVIVALIPKKKSES